MRPAFFRFRLWSRAALVCTLCGLAPCPAGAAAIDDVRQALAAQDAWLAPQGKAAGWDAYLLRGVLEEQLRMGANASPQAIARVLARYRSDAPGLDLPAFERAREALAEWRAALAPPAERFAHVVAAAKDAFDPVTDNELRAAREELAGRLAELERLLAPSGANAERWKSYVQWDTLAAHARGDSDDLLRGRSLVELQESVYRLTSGEVGLELAPFQGAAAAARRVLDLSTVRAGVEDQASFNAERLDELADYLRSDPRLLDPRDSYAAQQRLDLLEGAGWSPGVVEELRRRFGRANAHVTASEALVSRVAERPVQEQRPVRDVILGTRVRGTGATRGMLRVSTQASAESALLEFRLSGTTHSSTLGVNGPACIRTAGETHFTGSKRIEITRAAFAASPARVEASTRSRTTGLGKRGGGFGERIVVAVARKRVEESRGCANAIASRKAERLVATDFNAQVEQQLAQARRDYERQLVAPLQRRGAPLQSLALSTTQRALGVAALHAARGQLGAPDEPPPAPAGDLSVRLHQTAVNNLSAVFLGGATLSQPSADEPARLDIPLPEFVRRLAARRAEPEAEPDESFRPWSMEFRQRRPVSFAFREGAIEMIIHAARVVAGEDEFEDWDLIVSYRPVRDQGGWRLEMVGEIDVLPTGFDPRAGRSLRSVQVGVRNNLKEQLNARSRQGRGLPRTIPVRALELRTASPRNAGSLVATHLEAAGGWLSVAWRAE